MPHAPIKHSEDGHLRLVFKDIKKPFPYAEYERMANELNAVSDTIRTKPEMDHSFAERLVLLAKRIREDCLSGKR
jgi:hypothetical protein